MSVDIVFKIAGIGILVAVVSELLKRTGREDIAVMATIAGLAIVLLMVVNVISDLFANVRTIFQLY